MHLGKLKKQKINSEHKYKNRFVYKRSKNKSKGKANRSQATVSLNLII